MTNPFLTISHLNVVYPNGVQALQDVSFSVPKHAFVSIIGVSGSGKSTLLRSLNGLQKITSGSVEFDGYGLNGLSPKEWAKIRCEMGMIFQQFNLIKQATVLTNVLTGRLGQWRQHFLGGVFNAWPAQWIQDAHKALETVGLGHKALHRASDLSGGQQQRVAIARTLMQNPKLLLADEPVAALDPSSSHSVMEYLKKLNTEFGMTILCNLHFLSLVREYSTHVIALKGGQKVFEGTPSSITKDWFATIYGEKAKEVTIL